MKGILIILLLATVAMAARRVQWTRQNRAHPDEHIEIRFALRQQNLDVLESTLLDVSNPHSVNYGKWWTPEQILDLVAPEQEISESVAQFVERHGGKHVKNGRDFVSARMTVAKCERLFGIELHSFTHVSKPSRIIRATTEYTIPSEIFDDVAFVSGLYEFPNLRMQATRPAEEISFGMPTDEPGYVIPQTIQATYNIPSTFAVNKNASLCLAEFQNDQSFNKKDLKTFATQTATNPIDVTHIVGPFSGASPDLESTLDVQYGGSIALGNDVWFWTVGGWMFEFASEIAYTKYSPLVVSMSWGWPEPNQCDIATCKNGETSVVYVERVNTEFQKMGLRGITVLASSGDQGAPGDDDSQCSGPISTIFPGASPWILSVGATMLANTTTAPAIPAASLPPICKNFPCANTTAEVACSYPEALITSGGGFSNYATQPSYQTAAVEAYLKSGTTLPPASYFNASNRGFPDVAALGHNYLICASGQFEQVDGTSCSSPVFAAVISLLNSWRLNNNKSPLGFANPMIYAAYAADATTFIDITEGNNKCTEDCCNQYGYETAKGWDPVTGLGTPNFPALLKYVQSLP